MRDRICVSQRTIPVQRHGFFKFAGTCKATESSQIDNFDLGQSECIWSKEQ